MSTPLDEILGKREPVLAQETPETTPETPAAESAKAEPQAEAQPEPQEETPEGGKPPIGAIRNAEREKAAKRYTEQVADFERKLEESNSAWERRFNSLLTQLRPQPEPTPPQPHDIFDNPGAVVMDTVQPHLRQLSTALHHNARLVAEGLHKPEAVQEAEQAFLRAHQTGQIDPADAQRVLGSPNIYDAAVRWYRKNQILAEIGDDPNAYREKLRAEILAETQQQPPPAPAQQAPVLPGNFAAARNVGTRTGPAWAGPQPVGDIFARKRGQAP